MDTAWLREALARVGASQAGLARHLCLAPSAISRMLTGARQVKAIEAVNIASFLGVPAEEVLRHAGNGTAALPSEPGRRGRPRQATPPPIVPRQDLIPILSAQNERIGYTSRPANLSGVRDAYAIYMTGDSMEPRYPEGWLLHVNPNKPPIRGRDVVVTKTDRAVLVRQFVGRSDQALLLQQINPRESVDIPYRDVIACHLIVGVDQEG